MDFMIVLINKIREQPNLYIGKKSVERLKAFLDGYQMCMEEEGEHSYVLGDFQRYVQKRYNNTS